MDMDMDMDVERVAPAAPELTKIEPATFRGIDCAVLAERYAAYLRSKQHDEAQANLDVIMPVAGPSSENV